MMESTDDLPRLIGQRIAEARARRGDRLEDLAARTGVSRAMISRIERGEVHASAVVLDRLCAGLDMTLSALFARADGSPLRRRADQPVWRDPESGYLRREVAPGGTLSPVRIAEVEFPPGAEVALPASGPRALDQHVWVLEGAITLTVGGTEHALQAGDCLHMRPDAGITFRNPGPAPARYAVILVRELQP